MYSVFLNKAKFLPQKMGRYKRYSTFYCIPLKETMILYWRAAQTTHIKNIAVFFHPMEQIEMVSGKFNMVTMEAEFTRLESGVELLAGQSHYDAAGDNSPGEGGDM
jgi:hypothetical protein